MTTFTETLPHAGGFVVSEANGHRSRDAITVASGNNLGAGTVLGQITKGAAAAVAGGGNTGNGTMGAIVVGALALVGDYVLTITAAAANGGDFEVKDPQGDVVGTGSVGAAFDGGGLGFTLADGSTDFAVGDTFTITVAVGSAKFTPIAFAATDGSATAAGILYAPVDASLADADGVAVRRDAEVADGYLVWPDGTTAAQQAAAKAELAELGIIAR